MSSALHPRRAASAGIARAAPNKNCLISVVIPAFNPGPLLREQLEALARQRFSQPWEVVLADNGCTDGSLDAVAAMQDRLQIRIVDATAQRGPSYARNRGAEEARGTWLAFCDSDDVADPHWLHYLWEARTKGTIVGGVYDVTALNDPEQLKARGGPEYGRTLPEGPCRFLPYLPSGNMLILREALLALGGWDETLSHCEDVDLCWRAQLGGGKLSFVPEAVIKYRFRSSAIALFHQMRRYKAAEAQLFLRYRNRGAKRPSASEAIGRLLWLVSRSPYVVLGVERRTLWCSIAGTVIGRIQGSLRNRVIYL
jgi:glycosyltransferase involved in cell wall biosynthesis